jgi:glycolate oxidase
MALSKDAYRALEDIVGPENISDNPIILESAIRLMFRPAAVILPGSAEEVQAIVRTCNRYKIKYHAYSTGWGAEAGCQSEGVIQLDLRRMDRILDIDEKNMIAVIEPYVIGAALQAEAMKVGLNTHMIGAGASVSPLAAATSFQGPGPDSIYMGHSAENLLAMEWVMPTGEVLRTGSLGSGAGWFCGEGPGPSTRGIARGDAGHRGASGVFTKCALRLSAWPGPSVMPVEGVVPAYNSPLPENFRAYTLAFPSSQAYADASYKIWNAEIGYISHRQFSLWGTNLQVAILRIITDPTKQLGDLEEMLKMPEVQKLTEEMRISLQIILAGMSLRDIEYQDRALDEILAETGGWKVAAMLEPTMQKFTFLYLTKLSFKSMNGLLGASGTGFAQLGPPDFVVRYVEVARKVLEKHQKTGLLSDTGPDCMMGGLSHGGGGANQWFEQFSHYNPADAESVKAQRQYIIDAVKAQEEAGLPPGMETWFIPRSKEEFQAILAASPQPEMYRWQRKIREAFNPHDLGSRNFKCLEEPSP